MNRNKTVIVLSVVIVIACVAAVQQVAAIGKRSRVYLRTYAVTEPGLPVHIVRTAPELYALYRRSGVRGRVIVNVGRFLHFLDVGNESFVQTNDRFPLRLFDAAPMYDKDAGLMNYLWVAMRTGMVREIYHVVPSTSFAAKKEAARRDKTDVLSVSEHEITAHYWGGRRTISDRMPDPVEAVLLNVDASYFEAREPEDLVRDLIRSGLTADIVTLYLAEDNPEVGAPERDRLMEFTALLAGGTSGGH